MLPKIYSQNYFKGGFNDKNNVLLCLIRLYNQYKNYINRIRDKIE